MGRGLGRWGKMGAWLLQEAARRVVGPDSAPRRGILAAVAGPCHGPRLTSGKMGHTTNNTILRQTTAEPAPLQMGMLPP